MIIKNIYFILSKNLKLHLLNIKSAILDFIARVIRWNILDDFSYLVLMAISILDQFVISESSVDIIQPFKLSNFIHQSHPELVIDLAHFIAMLFFSPKSRNTVIEQFSKILLLAQSMCHPSQSSESLSNDFPNFIAILIFSVETLSQSFEIDHQSFPVEFHPSSEEIELFFTPVTDCLITFLHIFSTEDLRLLFSNISFIARQSSVLMFRFYQYAVQCISNSDAVDVASHGWLILSCIFASFEKHPLFITEYRRLFNIAIESLYILEQQLKFLVLLDIC